MADYAVASTQDRILELWMPRAKVTALGITNDSSTNQFNYWNSMPLQQGSIIIVQDESIALTYIITDNMGNLQTQQGYWIEL